MKNIKYIVIVLALSSICSFAQKKRKQTIANQSNFYVALQTGYQFATGNTQI